MWQEGSRNRYPENGSPRVQPCWILPAGRACSTGALPRQGPCLQDALGDDAGLRRAVDGLRREEQAEVLRAGARGRARQAGGIYQGGHEEAAARPKSTPTSIHSSSHAGWPSACPHLVGSLRCLLQPAFQRGDPCLHQVAVVQEQPAALRETSRHQCSSCEIEHLSMA